MTSRLVTIATLFLMATGVGIGHAQQPQPATPTFQSIGQIGGVAVGQIGTFNYYAPVLQDSDVRADRLSAVIARQVENEATMLAQIATAPIYIFLADPTDSRWGFDNSEGDSLYFMVVPTFALEREVVEGKSCTVADGISIWGMSIKTHAPRGSTTYTNTVRILEGNNVILRALCAALKAPSDGVQPATNGSFADAPLTRLEVFTRGELAPMVLGFSPARQNGIPFEGLAARGYWQPALALIDGFEGPSNRDVAGGPAARLATGEELVREGVVQRTFDLGFHFSTSLDRPFGAFELEMFGPRLEVMDRDWLATLQSGRIVVSGKAQSLMEGPNFRTFLPSFRVSDISSQRFLSHSNDVQSYLYGLHCKAVVFARESRLVAPQGGSDYNSCVYVDLRSRRQ